LQPYTIYRVLEAAPAPDSHGQCWVGEDVAESIGLCEYQTILPYLMTFLPREGRILESGCGLGRWVFYLRQRGFDVTGIDLARRAVHMAKAYDPSAPILRADVLHTPFPDHCFAAAISLGVVEHFEEGPQAALAELRRVLKPGGNLFISVPVQTFLRRAISHPLKDLYRWYRRRQGVAFAFDEYRFSCRAFERDLTAARFEVLAVVADDFLPPKNLGLYADLRFLQSRRTRWELNRFGKALAAVLRSISPWAACAGAHCVARRLPD